MHIRNLSWTFRIATVSVVTIAAWGQTISFNVAPVYFAGVYPTSVAAGNFNQDGKPDLAVTNQAGIAVLLNDGNGGFHAPVTYTVGTNPQSVAVADFDGDGKQDLAVVNQGSGNVSILLGKGDGTFQMAVNYPAGSSPRRVVIGDFNGDGKPDLAVVDAGFATGGVSILLNTGTGTFQAATFYGAGSVCVSVALGDFNHDSKLDLVVANSGSDNLSILIGNGNGTFQAAANISLDLPGLSVSPSSVAVGDFNLDGKPDIAVATPDHQDVAVLLGNGNGTFQSAIHYGLGDPNYVNNINVLTVADMNGDGYPDLVLANYSANHVTVLLNAGNGSFPTSKSYAAGSEPTGVAVADFDGDGTPDLAVNDNALDGSVAILLGNGDGTLQAAPLFRASYVPQFLAVGDFNGDGKLDVIAVSHYTATNANADVVMLGNGDGTFQAPKVWSNTGAVAVAVGDFNHDGKLDIAATNTSPGNGNVSVWLGKGDGTFQNPVSYTAGAEPQPIVAADLNHDGKLDLVVGNHGSSNVSVLIGNGDGTFQPAVNYPTPSTGTADSVAVADFNGDGIPDLAVAISGISASEVAILPGNGNGTFQQNYTVPAGFHSSGTLVIAAADLDGDSKFDLAVTDGNTLGVLPGAGNGTFSTPKQYLVGAGNGISGVVVVGDFNGDGKPDLLSTSRDGLALFVGTGNGFSDVVTFTPFLGGAAAVGDFDGDGRPDIVTADSSQDATVTDTVAMLLNTTVIPVPVTLASQPAGLQTAIDGEACTAPCNYTLNWGTLHSFTTSDYQTPIPGTFYKFNGWIDTVPSLNQSTAVQSLSNPVRIPGLATSITATFLTKYGLTLAASPENGGAVTGGGATLESAPGVLIDDPGAVPIAATPNSGWGFTNWTGANVASPSAASTTVLLAGPETVTANFTYLAHRCDLTMDQNLTIADVRAIIDQGLGKTHATADLNSDARVNIVDLQILLNAVRGAASCPA